MKRYDLVDSHQFGAGMEEHPEGDWVKWDDVEDEWYSPRHMDAVQERTIDPLRAVVDALPEALKLEYPLDHKAFREAYAKFPQAPDWIKRESKGGSGDV